MSIDQFREAIRFAGLESPDLIYDDGKLRRFSTNGKRGDDSGWYVLYGDGIPAGSFGDWRTGFKENWRADIGRALTLAEETAYRAKVDAMRREREAEEGRHRAEAANKAARIWKSALPALGEHPYLIRKAIKAHGARLHDNALVIPLRDGAELHSLQFITADSRKRFLTGGRVAGCYFSIGNPKHAVPICIVEGYATGATIHDATGYPVAVAFTAGNLDAVARAMRGKFPDVTLIVCADDDFQTDDNPGLTKAKAAAVAAGGKLAIPKFGAERPYGVSDFNDMAAHFGLEAVKQAITDAKAPQEITVGPASDNPSTDDADPVVSAFKASGFAELKPDATLLAIETALRNLVHGLTNSDSIRRATIREAAFKKLGEFHISAPAKLLDAAWGSLTDEATNDGTANLSAADVLVKLAIESAATLFHNRADEPFVTFCIDDHNETWPLRSKAARQWLTRLYYKDTRRAPNKDAMQTALGVMESLAVFDGAAQDVYIRSAWHKEALYYDLGDSKWQVVRIDAEGWEVINDSPVRFRRYNHTLAQVEPVRGGSIESIWDFLNVSASRDRRLIVSWLVVSLVADIPRPLLAINGDQGAAKSWLCKLLLSLIDPSATPCLRTKDATELIQGLAHRFAAVLDNVSTLPEWLSDLLCCAVTGDGFTKRMLFTDDDDVIYSYRRVLLFNGIGVVITKPDLLDRSILIQAERIPDDKRRDEKELLAAFERARPGIMGAIFDRLSNAIRQYGKVAPLRLPRMADFAQWAIAANGSAIQFLEDFSANVENQNAEALSSSVVATVLFEFLGNGQRWSGQPHELFGTLLSKSADLKIPSKSFPGNAAALGRKLREIRPNLLVSGMQVDFCDNQRPRIITLTRKKAENAGDAVAVLRLSHGKNAPDSIDGIFSQDTIPLITTPLQPEQKGWKDL